MNLSLSSNFTLLDLIFFKLFLIYHYKCNTEICEEQIWSACHLYYKLLFFISVFNISKVMFFNKLLNKGYEADHCELCQTQFNLMKFQRIHKCKRCQKFICRQCGKTKQKVIDKDGIWTKQTHRICTLCKQDFIEIHDTIVKNDMQWNRDTRMSRQWLQNIEKVSVKQKDYEYRHFLKMFSQNINSHGEAVEIIDKDVIKGRTDSSVFNFSMREFFYTVKSDIEDTLSRDNIKNVLYALAARYNKIGYCQGMSGVAAFLLCFSSQETAYTLFCDLLENVYPQDFFIRSEYGVSLSGLLAESHFLQEYFIHYLTVVKKPLIIKTRGQFYDENQLSHFRTIIQLFSSKALLSLFVGIVSFSNCIFIWQLIKEHRSFEVIQKAFIAIIYLNRQKILQNRSFKIIEEIFQRMNLEEFKQFYNDLEIDPKLRKQLLDDYYEGVKKMWNVKPDQQVKVLQKISNFTSQELNLLKNSFPQTQGVCIKNQQFTKLIRCYFDTLKKLCPNETILQTKSYFVTKIYQTFNKNNKQGLDFRQFILCLDVCTKSNVKQRIRAILGTFKDENGLITFENFQKLIKNISMISDDKVFEQKKQEFSRRMAKYFSKQQVIHFNELDILLNDDFINQLCFIVKSQTTDIVPKVIQKYSN